MGLHEDGSQERLHQSAMRAHVSLMLIHFTYISYLLKYDLNICLSAMRVQVIRVD